MGAVILNRVEHPSFPNTIAGVVYQPGAFTCMVDGQFNEPVADSAYRAAQDALNGADPSGGAIYYFKPGHGHQRVDLEPPPHQDHRQAPLLRVIKSSPRSELRGLPG